MRKLPFCDRMLPVMSRSSLLAVSLSLPSLLTAAPVNYEKEVLPFLKDNCIACHNKTTTKGGLNMETPELMKKGGDNGASIEPGAGAKSLVWQAAAGHWDSEMPPKGNKVGATPLDEAELALLKQWIDEGAHHAAKQERQIAWEPLPAAFAPIFACDVTPDGSLAAAARGNQIALYHLPTGALVTRLTDETLIKSGLYKKPGVAHRDIVPTLLFTPDGQRLLTGSYREVKVWKRVDITPRTVATTKPASTGGKFKLSPTPVADGVSLMDQATGKALRELKHGAKITAYSLSADEQKIATAGADHKIKIWETATGKLMLEIVSQAEADRQVAEKAAQLARATMETVWKNEMIKKAEKDVTDLAARLKKAHELADLAKKALEEKKKDIQPKTEAQAAAAKALKEVEDQIAKLPQGTKPDEALAKKLTESRDKADKAASALKLAQETLERAETAITDTANEIKVVTDASSKASQAVTAAKAAAEQAKKDQEAATAAKAAADKARTSSVPELMSLAFSPDGQQLAGLDGSEQVFTWAVTTGRGIGKAVVSAAGKGASLSWPGSEGCITTGDKASVLVPDPAKAAWKLEKTLGSGDGKSPITDRVNALDLAPDGRTLAVGSGEPSRSGDISLWDLTSGKLTARYDERHLDTVHALDFSPDGKLLASGGADKAVRITELSSGKMVKLFEGHTHHVLGLGWRADGRLLASSGADNVVKIWDWTTGDRRKNVEGWDKEVTALRYLPGADAAATTAGDGKVRLINSDGGEVKKLSGAADFMNSLGLTQHGEMLVAGGEDGVLHVWDLASAKETATFKADAP